MTADTLLSRLEGVKKTGDGKWQARCPSHADKVASLSIRELPDQRLLLHCFALCDTADVLSSVDLSFSDLYPERPLTQHSYPPERRPWIPSDAYETARHEVMIVALIGCDMHAQKVIAESDYQRLFVAVQRLNDIAGAAYGSR